MPPRAPKRKIQEVVSRRISSDVFELERETSSEAGSNEDPEEKMSRIVPSTTMDAMTNRSEAASNITEECDENDGSGISGEMNKMLASLGIDARKNLTAKRKRLQQFTQASWRSSTKVVDGILKTQQMERQKLNEAFCEEVNNILGSWEADLVKAKEHREKLQKLILQQNKLCQQSETLQSQRLSAVRRVYENLRKGSETLDAHHEEQQVTIQAELKKEMDMLQKKILMDTQQKEMANIRKSLETMFY